MLDQTLKHRLVGAAVLLAVAAILLPLVFDGANEDALLADTRLPAPPVVPDADVQLQPAAQDMPQAAADIAAAHAPAEPEALPPVAVAPGAAPATPAPPVPTTPPPAAAPPAVAVPAAPAPDPRLAALAEAWDVQLAAVSAADGAEKLRAKLVAAGYKARVRHVGNLYKVLAGPELRRSDAEQLRARLAADARVGKPNGVLARYVP